MKYCNNSNCVDGKVFDNSSSQFEECPLCKEIKLSQIESGVYDETGKIVGLSEKLGFKRIFTRLILEPEKIFGKYAYNHMDKSAIQPMIESLTNLMSSLSAGRVPKSSLLCYLGSKGDVELLGYLLLASAYKSDLLVHPLVTPFSLRGIKQDYKKYSELMHSDIVIATFTPAIKDDLYLVEDLLKERAYQGKPTIILLSDGVGLNSLIQRICSFEDFGYHQALYMGVPYLGATDDDDKKLARINKGIQNGNEKLGVVTPLLTKEDLVGKAKKSNSDIREVPKVSSMDIFGR